MAGILAAMKGAMLAKAEGLSDDEMKAIALYLNPLPGARDSAGDPNANAIWGPSSAEMPLDGPKKDGKVIWDNDAANTPSTSVLGKQVYGGVMDGAVPTVVDVIVYVYSGYAGRQIGNSNDLSGRDGNVLMTFSVDGKILDGASEVLGRHKERPMNMRRASVGIAALLALGACASPDLQTAAEAGFWLCPDGFEVKEGLNTNFPSDGLMRAFVVSPAKGVAGAAPVWVPLTGTVESTNANLMVARSGANALMADHGVTVIGPVRQCAEQDPDVGRGQCDGPGSNGWNWKPWNEGRAASAEGDKWKNDAGPDVRFLEAMVRCVGTKFPLDAKRLFVGGISSGGTLTNRSLTFDSKFWAGGMPISGEWYVTQDDGAPLSFNLARESVIANPTKIHQGRIGPYPLPKTIDSLVVITVWGGEKDLWDCGPPTGLCADYRPSTQAGSNYFSSMPNVVHVACSATHGHMWPQVNAQAFNQWALKTMASHPKGSDPKTFKLTAPPEGYNCKLGVFTDHY